MISFIAVSALSFSPMGAPGSAVVASRPAASVSMTAAEPAYTRRAALTSAAAAALAPVLPAFAGADPAYALKKDYPYDAKTMLTNMQAATNLERGAPGMEAQVKATRSEMNDFVAFYRRQPKVAGMPSFSTMYTAINTLSGHYASYGNKYPVPEKRKVRLQQQYKEIERALARGK